MPLHAAVDAEARLVRIDASGLVTLEDLLGGIEPMLGDPSFEAGMGQLIDLRSAHDTSLTHGEMRRLIEVLNAEPRIHGSPVAVVATRPVLFGVARMYEALVEQSSSPPPIRVFDEMADALAWLRRPGESASP